MTNDTYPARIVERKFMKYMTRCSLRNALPASVIFLATAAFMCPASAQNPELQQQVSDVQQSMAKNKQALAAYSWNEQVTISLKGEEKKQEHFQVRLGPDLKPEKTSLDPPPPPPSGGRLRQHIVAKKTDEYEDYANQMKALAQQYVPPDGTLLQQAYSQGNISLGEIAGAPDQIQLVIHNYLKPGDSMTLVFDKTQKELLG